MSKPNEKFDDLTILKCFLIPIFICLSSFSAHAICKSSFINPVTEVRWSCMLPISLGGVSASTIPVPEAAMAIFSDKALSGAVSPVCTCWDPTPRVGLTFSMNNVFRIVESTKDPFCFPSMGFDIEAEAFGAGGQDGGEKKSSKTTFNYTHLISFVPTQVLNIFIDSLCMQTSETQLAVLGLSEIDPTAKSSELALIMAPESILFANPIAQAYCMVDASLTLFEQTDPIGYWCAGGHSIFPLSNHSTETEYVDAASINAAKYLFKLSRTGQLFTCLGSQAVCGCAPSLIWNKREFRLQVAKPIPDIYCHRIGKPSLTWNIPNKNPALIPGADNLAYLIWRRRDCCAF